MRKFAASTFCFVLLSAFLLELSAKSVEKPKQNMKNTLKELKVNLIREVVSEPGEKHKITTDCSGVLFVTDGKILSDLHWFLAKRLPASIEYNRKNRQISSVSSAPTDRVTLVATQASENRVVVQLMKRPTMLFLSKNNPRFDSLYHLLDNARREKKMVAVGVLPGGSSIEDVRLDNWK